MRRQVAEDPARPNFSGQACHDDDHHVHRETHQQHNAAGQAAVDERLLQRDEQDRHKDGEGDEDDQVGGRVQPRQHDDAGGGRHHGRTPRPR